MTDLTILTPISPDHLALFPFAHASVQAQTLPCVHLWAVDEDRKGPGYVRNRLLERVQTSFVSFIDSDDLIEPDFAKRTLQAVQQYPDWYCYTDWWQFGEVVQAPECAWVNQTYHLVTSVVKTEWVRSVGGFDESLIALEDTDFWVKLSTSGYGGKRLPIPLVHYRANGGRAVAVHQDQTLLDELNAEMKRRYGDKQVSCCGDPNTMEITPQGEKQEGDVLVQALWQGNREERGRVTGRRTPRTSWPKTFWFDRRDAEATPNLFAIVPQVAPLSRPLLIEPAISEVVDTTPPKGLAALEAQLLRAGLIQVPPMSLSHPSSPPLNRARLPNVGKVKRLASVARGDRAWPIFVMPRQFYPSYVDIWELTRLSGFELIYQDEADLSDPRQTFIFAAPERIPDCTHAHARTILWQFEYTGEYTSQECGDTVSEVWSSDPAHAERTGAKYVLFGSHRGLNPMLARADTPEYDVTMLAYMVDRRLAIKDRLSGLRWPKNYPGHAGLERHNLLARTRLMLHVHQHAQGAIAPQRFSLAAAYQMPLISERVDRAGAYDRAVMWADYEAIPARVNQFLEGRVEQDTHYDDALYKLLCVEYPFERGVWEALRS